MMSVNMLNMTGPAPPVAANRDFYVVAAVDAPPYVNIIDDARGRRRYDGFLIDIMNEISGLLGFDYRIRPTPDGRYGSQLPDSTWTGMIGDIVRGDADVALGPLQMTMNRENAVDFSKPYLASGSQLMVKKPVEQWEGIGLLSKPFTHELWFFILIAIIVYSLLFYIISRLSPYSWLKKLPEKDKRAAVDTFNLKNSFLFVFSTITWQGYREAPRCFSGRILAAFWWIFTFFMIVAYTSNLTAILLVRRNAVVEVPYKDLNDLMRQDLVEVGVVRNSFQETAVERMSSQSGFGLWDYIKRKNSFLDDYPEGVKKVRESDGNLALVVDSADGAYYTSQYCDLAMFGQRMNSVGMAFACTKGTDKCEQLSRGLLTMKETGRIHYLYKKWFVRGLCYGEDENNVVSGQEPPMFNVGPLNYRELTVPLLLLFFGAILALVIMIGEIFFVRFIEKRAKEKSANEAAADDVEKQEMKETNATPTENANPFEEETRLDTTDETATKEPTDESSAPADTPADGSAAAPPSEEKPSDAQ